MDFKNLTKGMDFVPESQQFELVDDSNLYKVKNIGTKLLQGKVICWFNAASGKSLRGTHKKIVASLVNLSGFKDETKENGVPQIDVSDEKEAAKYTFICSKAIKLAPFANLNKDITPQLFASADYQAYVQKAVGKGAEIIQPSETWK
eukprot:UN25805